MDTANRFDYQSVLLKAEKRLVQEAREEANKWMCKTKLAEMKADDLTTTVLFWFIFACISMTINMLLTVYIMTY